MIERSWQGRALGVMQSAGSTGRLLGPLLGGWLLMFDLRKPVANMAARRFWSARSSVSSARSCLLREETRGGSLA